MQMFANFVCDGSTLVNDLKTLDEKAAAEWSADIILPI